MSEKISKIFWSTNQLLSLFWGLYWLLAWALLSIIHTDGQQRRGFTVNVPGSHKAINPLIYGTNDAYLFTSTPIAAGLTSCSKTSDCSVKTFQENQLLFPDGLGTRDTIRLQKRS